MLRGKYYLFLLEMSGKEITKSCQVKCSVTWSRALDGRHFWSVTTFSIFQQPWNFIASYFYWRTATLVDSISAVLSGLIPEEYGLFSRTAAVNWAYYFGRSLLCELYVIFLCCWSTFSKDCLKSLHLIVVESWNICIYC